jgi:hypothetical protein
MATVVNFEELNPGAKFDFETDKKGKTLSWVKVRAYSNDILSQIRNECVKNEVEYKAAKKYGQLQRIEYQKTDDERMKHLLWDYVIMDWSGFVDPSGNPIACSKENKIKLMSQWPAFSTFIDKCLERLTPDVNAEVEASEKN